MRVLDLADYISTIQSSIGFERNFHPVQTRVIDKLNGVELSSSVHVSKTQRTKIPIATHDFRFVRR